MKTVSIASCLVTVAVAASALVTRPARADVASCINASESALGLREQGHLRASLEKLAVCADSACPAEVRSECARRVDEVRAALPTLILATKDGAGNDVVDVKVTLDGAPLGRALEGRAIALDPGEHTFTFSAAARPVVEKKLVIHEAEKDRRETVVIPMATAAAPLPAPPPPPSWSTSRTLAVIAAGVGVIGVGVGAGLGLAAKSSQSSEKSACPAAGCADHTQAVSDYNSAHEAGVASTVAFAAGAAFIAAGAVFWFTAPPARDRGTASAASFRVVPAIGDRSGGLVFDGSL
jgi:hypothetical protein